MPPLYFFVDLFKFMSFIFLHSISILTFSLKFLISLSNLISLIFAFLTFKDFDSTLIS